MKKFITFTLVGTLALLMLVGCGSNTENNPADNQTITDNVNPSDTPTPSPTDEPTATPTETPTPTPEPTETPTPTPTEPPHEHTYTESTSKEATCTEAGEKTFTCDCGDTYTEPIEETGHDYKTVAGSEVKETCEADGKKADTKCSLCGDTIKGAIVSATGHSYGNYVYNNDATTEKDGTETATCSVCGDKTTRTKAGTKIKYDGYDDYGNGYTIGSDGYKHFNCNCPYPLYVLNDNGSDYLWWYSLGYDTSSGLSQQALSILQGRYPNSTFSSGAKNGPCEGIYLDGTLFLYEAYPIDFDWSNFDWGSIN